MSIRSAMIHGTGYTAGDLIDAAVTAAGSGGSPKPGEPTRFLTLTYHHPGNEDGNSVSATTGIPIPNSTIAENTYWTVAFHVFVRKTSDGSMLAFTENTGVPAARQSQSGSDYVVVHQTGQALSSYMQSLTTPHFNKNGFWDATNEAYGDPWLGFDMTFSGNSLNAVIQGMSTNIPTDWTITVQLTPIAP